MDATCSFGRALFIRIMDGLGSFDGNNGVHLLKNWFADRVDYISKFKTYD